MIKFSKEKVLLLHKLITDETNGIRIHPTVDDVARVGMEVALGSMNYQELLNWIIENE